MSVIKLTRSVLFNRNLNEVIKIAGQQTVFSRHYSPYLVNSHGTTLKNLTPKYVAITLVNNYATDKGKVVDLFQNIGSNLNADMVKDANSIFQFVLSGEEEGKWFLDLKNGDGKHGKGDSPQPADVTLTMDSKNFLKMFDGKLKPTTAYMTGRLKIKGNLQTALKLEKIMNQLKSK